MSKKDEIVQALIPPEIWEAVQTKVEAEDLDPADYSKIRRKANASRLQLVRLFRGRDEMRAALAALERDTAALDAVREKGELLATSGEWSMLILADVDEWVGSVGRVLAAIQRIRSIAAASPILVGDPEAEAIIDTLIAELDVARLREEYNRIVAIRATAARAQRIAAHRPPAETVVDTSCAENGCTRPRVFFDEAGVGYCKRHGNERGLRPHGKIT